MATRSTTARGLEIERLAHSAVRIESDETRVYLDVFDDALSGDEPPGGLVLSSHAHWDHFDPGAINQVASAGATVIAHETSDTEAIEADIITVGSNEAHTVGV